MEEDGESASACLHSLAGKMAEILAFFKAK